MADPGEIGRVVWYDCLTHDVAGAMRFYAEVAGFAYRFEHAEHCAWADGPADYPLIVANGVAHGGFVDPCDGAPARWLPYVAVADADAACAEAQARGGAIVRAPFDVPGAGRAAVIADPFGALIAPFVRAHALPPPEGTFVADVLMTDDAPGAQAFYRALFGWTEGTLRIRTPFDAAAGALWLPVLATGDVAAATARATEAGGVVREADATGAILSDPMGAAFMLTLRG